MAASQRLAVIGQPIAHSKSPAIHAAAYRELGLPWQYDRVELAEDEVAGFLDGLDAFWRGLSVTAPNKAAAALWARQLDAAATLTGAANTLLIAERAGWNTDVQGISAAIRAAGVHDAATGIILGGGATARSAIVALAELGVEHLTIALRSAHRVEHLAPIAERLGVRWHAVALTDRLPIADVAVSTLPAHAGAEPRFTDPPLRLLDAAYAGTSRFAELPDANLIDGIEMLLQQALVQVRIFVARDPATPLDDEDRVWAAMRAAVGLD